MPNDSKINFVFFGTSEEAVYALEALEVGGFMPRLIVTAPDKPAGRHLALTAPLAKKWALGRQIPVFQPEKLDPNAIQFIAEQKTDIFVVVGYGKILPKNLLELPKGKTINIHPSLLPLYRGPAPIEGPILNGAGATGVTLMMMDAEADHGPIILQEKYILNDTETTPELTKILFIRGGELLANILPDWLVGRMIPRAQDHTQATYTKKIKKEDGLVNLETDSDETLWRKFRAYSHWPRIFFFENSKRIIITKARLENEKFIIEKIIPEGGKEQIYKSN